MPDPKYSANSIGQLDRSEVYRLMPREQQLLQSCATGHATNGDIRELVKSSTSRLKHADVVRYSLLLLKMGDIRGFDLPVVTRSVSSLLRRLWIQKSNWTNSLRLGFFYDRPYFRQIDQSVIASASHHQIVRTSNMQELIEFGPDVILSPQAHPADIVSLRSRLPSAFFVYMRHGLVSKTNALVTASYYDAVCVSSPFMHNYFVRCGAFAKRSVWVTGYPQMDGIASAISRERQTTPTILYAPTHNPNLTSAGWVTPQHFIDYLDKNHDVRLIVKLHPNLAHRPSSTWKSWQEASRGHARMEFVEDVMDDLSAYLSRASVLVSDFSSALFLFVPFDRPIILLNNPSLRSAQNFDPNGIEWTCRDVGEEVDSLEALHGVLSGAFLNPNQRKAQRQKYTRMLFGDTLDGKCGSRIIARIEALFGFSLT